MPKFSEQTLTNWTKPPSDSEQTKLENSLRMVRDAINTDPKLKNKSKEIFGQGSYANDTNVRLNSDIDINVRYTGAFYYNIPPETKKEDFGLTNPTSYSFEEFKDDVETALVNHFGRNEVTRNDKCITIKENSYRIETDVVPTWNYRRYSKDGSYVLGAAFFTEEKNKKIVNYPIQHISNAKEKNAETSKRFKRLTRLHRKLRYKMIDDGENVSDNITSFLLECLVWNIPNSIFNNYDTWTERLKQSIIYIYNQTQTDDKSSEWGKFLNYFIYLLVENGLGKM
ncbi:MAG: nucleotidyltransferase [Chryseobacterium sp.]|uniref:nucleotidyltransferase domain-containing protein n=1 Tax=Chryseobacterium sp. TaxID=1871047 RepID=UPI0025BEE5E2|nr:nucleotidyltransferase [Chryseobacterium sp.]MCJ7933332.1 nucleotidyltransferase [Chryseobacterium sp.]